MADTERKEMLTRVRIEGFRSIAYADLELRGVNVFIGANGAGKSNFIDFLQMLQSVMRESLPRYVNEQRGANALLHFGSQRTPQMTALLESEQRSGPYTYRVALSAVPGDRLLFDLDEVSTTYPGTAGVETRAFRVGEMNSDIPKSMVRPMNAYLKEVAGFFFKALSEAGIYHFENATATALMRGFQSTREDQRLLPHGENVAVMLNRMWTEFPDRFYRVQDELSNVLPAFKSFILRPEEVRGKEQIELRWLGWDSDYVLGPDQLSDGSIRAVSLLTLLLQPDEWKPGIIVIDEPELGLHPYAVGQIGRLIAEAGTTRQVIVSTQSPGLVAQFEPEDVIVVETENGASSFRRLDRERLRPWLEAYDGDLGKLFEMNVTGGAPQ